VRVVGLVACDHWTGALTVLSPLLMTFFLVKGTGNAAAGKAHAPYRPGYAAYASRTSAFPLPPRKV
jgi:steroid 5-alpha reductase family enzyme